MDEENNSSLSDIFPSGHTASQEYLDVAPDSPDKTAAPLKVDKEPRKRKMPNEKNLILRRSERRAFGDQEDAPLKKKDRKDVDISLPYGGVEVPWSPLVYMVQEDRTPIVSGKGLTLGQIWDVAIFNIDGKMIHCRNAYRCAGVKGRL